VCSVLDRVKDRWYVLDPTHLHALAQAAVRTHPDDINAIIPYIVSNLTAEYPSSEIALNLNASEWVLSNAGGAMGAMYIVPASITEYLFIFGTPLGTEGHTGMHTADDYFHILIGEQWAFDLPKLEGEVYRPGDVHVLPRERVKQYKMHEGCFALEYARGWIPLMLPFGVLDVFTSTLDYWSLYHTVRIFVREFARNLLIGKT
ncbi:C-8 sterol isomerase, partial [Cerioporus squamosus]